MTANTISTVRFHNYWKLLKQFFPAVENAILFDGGGNLIWQSARKRHPHMEHITRLAQQFQHRAGNEELTRSTQSIDNNQHLELMLIKDPEIDSSLTVALLSPEKAITRPQLSSENRSSIELLNRSLLTEFALIHKIIDKEQELNDMASELSHRYEELNLLYSSDGNIQNLTHGRELLQQIVVNASNFMDIDLASIILPDKNITVQYSKPLSDSNLFPHLLNGMRGEVFRLLKTKNRSIVVNHRQDSEQAGIYLEMPYKFIVSPLGNTDNDVIGLMTIVNRNSQQDFTNSDRNLLEVLANKASNIVIHNFDPLTGLENNHSFEMIVLDMLKKTWKNGSQHAIAQIDIDKMAVINGISGIQAGDSLIKSIAEILTRMVRSSDTVSRLGADKFSILFSDCDLEQAHVLLGKIAREITEIPFHWDNEIHEVSVSIGVAPVSSEIQSVSNVISNVESARLAAKERGRNQIQVFQLDDRELLKRKSQINWVSRIQSALRQDHFELYAQTINRISGAACPPHFEILLRMTDEQGNIVSPGQFLPAAEKFFLMPNIDRWVISHTFQLMYQQQQTQGNLDCEVSINLSGQSLSNRGLDDFIINMFEKYPLDPALFCFEVTESTAITNFQEAQIFIARVKNLGCKFSLDDFGTGLSSFAYLKDMDVDFLKIDGSFVQNITQDKVSFSMVSAMNQIGHAMNLTTIAEYVENEAILEVLKEIGIDYAQGYCIGKPQPFYQQLLGLQKGLTVNI